ncbi:MAG: acyltransferase [Planctomycetales bacterium]|nr:acyltransferase [Planctomycetales bacterium]
MDHFSGHRPAAKHTPDICQVYDLTISLPSAFPALGHARHNPVGPSVGSTNIDIMSARDSTKEQEKGRTNMNVDKWPNHLYALDVSRGVAALGVVFWHWQHFAYDGTELPENFQRNDQPLYQLLRIFYEEGGLGVQYFFILSGFIFYWLYGNSVSNKLVSVWEFAANRFSRLYPLHFITLLAVAVLQFLYVSREGVTFVYPNYDTYHFFLNLCFASYWGFENGWSFNGPVWSVSIEVLLYGIFFLVAYLRLGGWMVCLSVSLIAFPLSYVILQRQFNGMAMFFLGGLVFHSAVLLSSKRKAWATPVYLIAASSWGCVIVNYYFFDLSGRILELGLLGKVFLNGFPFYILFPTTALSLVLMEIHGAAQLKSLSWIGDITYSTYLLHFPLQLLCGLAISYGLLGKNFYLHPVSLIIFFMVLIPLSYATFVKFERPIQKTLRAKLVPQR